MLDFIRTTHAPRRRQFQSQEVSFWMGTKRKYFFSVVAILLLSCVMGSFILWYRSVWRAATHYAVLLVFGKPNDVARPLMVVSVNKQDRTVSILPLPPSMMVEALSGYGLYKSASLYGLTTLEKQTPTFLLQTIGFYIGIDLYGMVWVPQDFLSSPTPTFLSQVFFETLRFRNATDMSYGDRYGLWSFLHSVRPDQYTVLDMSSSNIVKTFNDSETLVFDPVRADPIIFQLFANRQVWKENFSITVVNTTKGTRVGNRIARALMNMGVNVTNITTSSEILDQTMVYYKEKEQKKAGFDSTATVSVLLRTLRLSKDHVEVNTTKSEEYRSDVVIMVGKDTARLLLGSTYDQE